MIPPGRLSKHPAEAVGLEVDVAEHDEVVREGAWIVLSLVEGIDVADEDAEVVKEGALMVFSAVLRVVEFAVSDVDGRTIEGALIVLRVVGAAVIVQRGIIAKRKVKGKRSISTRRGGLRVEGSKRAQDELGLGDSGSRSGDSRKIRLCVYSSIYPA